MQPVNVATLARLADKDVEKTATDFGALPLDIRESVVRLQNKARQDVVDAAAGQIVALLEAKDAFVVAGSQKIRQLEAEIEAQKKLLGQVNRATKYGTVTQNFLPLSAILGLGSGGAKSDLTKIPADWVEPAAAAAATETAPAAQ